MGKEEKAEKGKKEDRSPGEETVVGGKKNLEEDRRAPKPVAKRNIA